MTVRKIVSSLNRMLRQRSALVSLEDRTIGALVKDMLDTMYAAGGLGLAAVQIGVLKQVIVVDLSGGVPPSPQIFINPEVIEASGEQVVFREGCLSLPGVMVNVKRPANVHVRYRSIDGEVSEIMAHGLLAICLQHEIDHLDGVLITDHVSPEEF
ncbi:peptide deformylase [Agrobacterium tumefaciens]|uniref:Peptide deformylase n=1 Tax=Agrobacterium tumefaciens TaxID=358 RepID=A0A176XFH8_AGRTU|nr:peptide deformylase [Agrobacterium tumefaciens]